MERTFYFLGKEVYSIYILTLNHSNSLELEGNFCAYSIKSRGLLLLVLERIHHDFLGEGIYKLYKSILSMYEFS
jgi:hypothetical protein